MLDSALKRILKRRAFKTLKIRSKYTRIALKLEETLKEKGLRPSFSLLANLTKESITLDTKRMLEEDPFSFFRKKFVFKVLKRYFFDRTWCFLREHKVNYWLCKQGIKTFKKNARALNEKNRNKRLSIEFRN